jgi:hypothetical protein
LLYGGRKTSDKVEGEKEEECVFVENEISWILLFQKVLQQV